MTQEQALAIMESGASVLLTGAAGTGKTYTLNKFISRARHDGKSVAVTATTGLAATHLGGNTIHSWSGIGVADELSSHYATNLSKARRDSMNTADVLIVDEISMLHDFRLDMIDNALRLARDKKDVPFGGLQVVLCGDFFQLPPINRQDSRPGSFVTQSEIWQAEHFNICYLQEQFRQKDDQQYTDILNGIRAGQLLRSQLDALQARKHALDDPFSARTRLLTTNIDVDGINAQHLEKLTSTAFEYNMQSTGSKQYVEQLKRSCLAPEVLRLKKGASVMCIKNSQDKKYANGSLGEVVDFEKSTNYPIVSLASGRLVTIRPDTWELRDGEKKRASLSQLPLRLAWAITVHKSQGMTLDAARVDLSKAFVEGMGYVALSRVRGLKHLILDGLNGMALKTSPLARQIDASLLVGSSKALQAHTQIIADWLVAEKTRKAEPKTPKKSKNAISWADKLQKMRETYPNAYRPWEAADDQKLISLHDKGKSTKYLTTEFGRHAGSIEKRLEKLLEAESTNL